MTELLMSGHDRTYLPPRSVRHAAAEREDDLSARIASGKATSWDLLSLDASHPARQWAESTLDSVIAAGSSGALECHDCEDTGFYGLTASGNDDLLVGLLRRVGDGEYESLQADGVWQGVSGECIGEVLTLEIAEDLADALTAGAPGLLRKYAWPLAFLPPAAVTAAAPAADTLIETGFYAIVDDDDPGAVMQLVRVDEDALTAFGANGWEPWEAPDSELLAIYLDDDAMADVQRQMATDFTVTATGLVADAPLTVSPNPKAEKLRRYWSTGRGGAKIRWNGGGDFRRCVRQLRKYLGLRVNGYCFTGDTEFITRNGVMTFAEAVDTTQLVLTQANPVGRRSTPVRADGYWVEAPIRSFGEQKILRVTLKRGGIEKTIRATPEHRWLAAPNGRNIRRFDVESVVTADLQPGMSLAMLSASSPVVGSALPSDAVCAGAVFGDGSRAGASRTRIDLYRFKRELSSLFEPYASSISVGKTMTSTSELADRIYGLPGDWKNPPTLDQDPSWLRGWLAGLLATDGSVGTNGAVTISSSNAENLRVVQDVCHRLGIITSGFGSFSRVGYGKEATLIYRLLLSSPSLSANMFVRSDQRARFKTATKSSGRWTVVSVEDQQETEEVFCATVPETESFALADNIWTLNCANLHKRNTGMWPGDRRNRGLISTGIEQQLVASLQSGLWSGESERNSDMAMAELKDGIYCEVDDNDTGLLRTLTAGGFPVAPPDEWYANPEFSGPTPMQIDDDGRVYGHIATFDVTHIGMAGAVHAPKSKSGYAYFMTGALKTASGKQVNVGQLTLSGGHAPLHADAGAAVKHYDDTNSGVADVAVGEDSYGIWAAGSLRPSVTPEQVRVFRASPLSGDWRPINGNLELVAACAVNVPGFPTARARVAGGAILALVAAGARPLAVHHASMIADAALLERLDALEARIPLAAEIGEIEVVEPTVEASVPAEVPEIVATEAATPVVEVAAAEPEPAIPAPVETQPVAASTAVAEAPVAEEASAEAVAAAQQETPEEVQPEAADKLDPEQVKQAREDAAALRRDWLRREINGS